MQYNSMFNCFDRDTKVHSKLRYRFMYLSSCSESAHNLMWQAFNMSFTVVVMFITVFHSLEMDLQCFRYHFMIHLPIKDSLGLRKPLHFLTPASVNIYVYEL